MSGWYEDSTAPATEPSGPWWDQTGVATEKKAEPLVKTREQFLSEVAAKPGILANGKFKAPKEGVNFMLEGMTPDEAYSTAQGIHDAGDWSEDNRLGKPNSKEQANAMLDAGWRTGPNNGGGFLGGIGNAAQGIFDGVRTNPAIMAALTAGVGSSVNSGLQGLGMSANTAKIVTPMVTSAGKTLVSGGSIADAAKGAGLAYVGGQAGNAASDAVGEATGSAVAAKIAGNIAKTVVTGGNVAGILTNAAISQITDNIEGFNDLSETQKAVVNATIANAVQGKKITPALIAQVMSSASGDVEAQKKTATRSTAKTGGWA